MSNEPLGAMANLTLKGIPDEVMRQLRRSADSERRSLNQQAIVLLERALAEHPASFKEAYRRFRQTHGDPPPGLSDADDLRSEGSGRSMER
jgi:plasmid stability protein